MRKGTHPRTALGQTAAQMIRRYYLHDVARDSAALTYYLLFAIFPLLIFVSTCWVFWSWMWTALSPACGRSCRGTWRRW